LTLGIPSIIRKNRNKSGIYLLTNIINNKKYIGSAQDLEERLSFYFSKSKMNCALKQGKSYICSAILKDGLENFSIKIIEYCEVSELLAREKYYINFLESEYNIIKDPTVPPMLNRSHSEESKQKISDSKKGKNHTLKTREKISEALKGENHPMYGKPKPKGAGSPAKKCSVFDKNTNETIVYESISEAARALNIKKSIIDLYFIKNQIKPYKGRYIFKKL
jgi:group I intron endonuclease